MTTAYHAKYFAHELTRKTAGGSITRLSRSLFDAKVDLNPHQIEAALFALRSPLSKGVLLADEVGLGKTIEAGLVLCQHWAERKRRLLIICPASIRKQWELELEEKFNLPALVLDQKAYSARRKDGYAQPFEDNAIVIVSFNFAAKMQLELRPIAWDLVVIDEAHKLRNAYRESNRIGQAIKWAIEERKKLLLTATPLQNSLLELYGLSTLIDNNLFGDIVSFRSQYSGANADLGALRNRLESFCKRSLRKQVSEYVSYTQRKAITRPFNPTIQEHHLYEAVSNFLVEQESYALPKKQRHLTVLILRKLLASSSHAIAGTLETMKNRLEFMQKGQVPKEDLTSAIALEEELNEEILDAMSSVSDDAGVEMASRVPEVQNHGRAIASLQPKSSQHTNSDPNSLDPINSKLPNPEVNSEQLGAEIENLQSLLTQALSIGVDTKTKALLQAIEIGFQRMEEMGAAKKALIFTESRRTQDYLQAFLEANSFEKQVITFNGTNSTSAASKVYDDWLVKNSPLGRSTGSKTIDLRTALIEYFRDEASIMIATEAAAEGVNLQFCSLVINYDLPWNPQRIEQRIGRCHRYGQKHDVVVINFLNERNQADKRVYELLNDKFNLFEGLFGSSDEVLGTIEAGLDFETRILAIYQECRTPEEIDAAFKQLQAELEEQISSRLEESRRTLFEHFDADVHDRLRLCLEDTRQHLDIVGRQLWAITKWVLRDRAEFCDSDLSFLLTNPPSHDNQSQSSAKQVHQKGLYFMASKGHQTFVTGKASSGDSVRSSDSYYLYRFSHPLGEYVLECAKAEHTPTAHLIFDVSNHPAHISVIEALKGQSGYLALSLLQIDSLEQEEYLLFSGFADSGQVLDQETIEKLFVCSATLDDSFNSATILRDTVSRLEAEMSRHIKATIHSSLENNREHFIEARDRLEKWAEDIVLASERALRDTKERIKELKKRERQAVSLDVQLEIQEDIRKLEREQRRQRENIFKVEDEISAQRDELITALQKRLSQKTSNCPLFTIRWTVV